VDINHSRYLSSHHSTKPDKYDGSARVSLQEGIHPAVHDSIGQTKLFKSPSKLYEEPSTLATTPPHKKTSPQDMSICMDNHSFSPTVATLKRYQPIQLVKYKDPHKELLAKVYMKKVKNKDSHTKSTNRPQRKKDIYNVHGNVKNAPGISLNYDVPSSFRHPKNAPSISLNLDLSPNMAKTALKMLEYKQSVLNTNMIICSNGYINSHQVQKKLQSQQKALQDKVKTSSDSDATQHPDLARDEGLNPREGITRHHALPVPPRAAQHAVRPSQLLQSYRSRPSESEFINIVEFM
jgi:hypothetical protein